jgi:hypothetical protein
MTMCKRCTSIIKRRISCLILGPTAKQCDSRYLWETKVKQFRVISVCLIVIVISEIHHQKASSYLKLQNQIMNTYGVALYWPLGAVAGHPERKSQQQQQPRSAQAQPSPGGQI